MNDHGFKKKNRVEIVKGEEIVDGYIVAVTKKYIHYVRNDHTLFCDRPPCERVKSKEGVVHVRPYLGDIDERVMNWQWGPVGDSEYAEGVDWEYF